MNREDECLATLRALTNAADVNGIGLAEKAIDDYVKSIPEGSRPRALAELRLAVVPSGSGRGHTGAFAALLVSYIDKQIDRIRSM